MMIKKKRKRKKKEKKENSPYFLAPSTPSVIEIPTPRRSVHNPPLAPISPIIQASRP